jgi:Protein of unknown function (DUF2934)
MADREDRIRELAYLLWLEEGYPEGQAERHWLTAEALIESEAPERKRIEGKPSREARDSAAVRGVSGRSQVFRRRGAVSSGKDQ